MELWQYIILFLVGIVVGFVNVMAGGGSLLSIPIMLFMGVPGPVANGTNRIAIIVQMATAVVAFFRKGYSDFKLSLSLALAALPGAIAGAYVGTGLEGIWFNRIVAIITLVVMLVMATQKDEGAYSGAPAQKPRLLLAHILMFFVGLYGGFIQIGIGFLFLPILNRTLGLDLVRVNMHKTFIISFYTTAALIVFAWQVEIFWILGICLAAGTSIGAWLSAQLQVSRGEKIIRVVLNTVLVLIIIRLLFFS